MGMESCVRCDVLLVIAVDKDTTQVREATQPQPPNVPDPLVNMWTHIQRTRILDVTATTSSQETFSTDGIFFEICRVLLYRVKDVARDWCWWLSASERERDHRLLSLEKNDPGLIRLEHGFDRRARHPHLPMHLKF